MMPDMKLYHKLFPAHFNKEGSRRALTIAYKENKRGIPAVQAENQ